MGSAFASHHGHISQLVDTFKFDIVGNQQFSAAGQLSGKLIHLLSKLSNLLRVGISVYNGLVLDVSSSEGILKGVEGFFEVDLSRGHTSNHRSSRVTS